MATKFHHFDGFTWSLKAVEDDERKIEDKRWEKDDEKSEETEWWWCILLG